MTFAELVKAVEQLRIERGGKESAAAQVVYWSHGTGNKTLTWEIFWIRHPDDKQCFRVEGPTAHQALYELMLALYPQRALPPDVDSVDPVVVRND